MECQKCGSGRLASIVGLTVDCNCGEIEGKDYSGYVPNNIGIGGGKYIKLTWCLDCGQIQGKWPVSLQNRDDYNDDYDVFDGEEEDEKDEKDEEDNRGRVIYPGKYKLVRV